MEISQAVRDGSLPDAAGFAAPVLLGLGSGIMWPEAETAANLAAGGGSAGGYSLVAVSSMAMR
jgi:hypothetical protein